MNQDDELAPRFNEFGDQAMPATVPAGSEAVRESVRRRHGVQALAAGAVTVAVLAAGGTWLALHRGGSSGPPAAASSRSAHPGDTARSAAGSPVGSSAASPVGSSAASPAGEGAPAAAALPRCHTGDLDAGLGGAAGGGAAGSVYLDLGLTNRSSHPCRVYGFPGITLVDSAGRWIPTTLRRDATEPRLLTLEPGQTAWAVVHYTHMPADDETTPCQPAAVGLAVTPPDETAQLTVNRKFDDVCQHGQLATSAMVAQRAGG